MALNVVGYNFTSQSAVPLPASFILLATGLGIVGSYKAAQRGKNPRPI